MFGPSLMNSAICPNIHSVVTFGIMYLAFLSINNCCVAFVTFKNIASCVQLLIDI